VNIGQRGEPGSITNIRIGTTDSAGTSNIFMSGSLYITGSVGMKGSIIPDAHNTYTLGTPDIRWAHIYTGDLHLRNERGDWTVIEENDFLRIVNNKTGKNYKIRQGKIVKKNATRKINQVERNKDLKGGKNRIVSGRGSTSTTARRTGSHDGCDSW
jgi:hypothetical protein